MVTSNSTLQSITPQFPNAYKKVHCVNQHPSNENPPSKLPQQIFEQAKSASSQLKAMAHESRLAILFHLYNGEQSVSELEVLLGMRQPAVSQQLARLRSDNMVKTKRRGKQVYYTIASEHAFVIVELLHRLYGKEAKQ